MSTRSPQLPNIFYLAGYSPSEPAEALEGLAAHAARVRGAVPLPCDLAADLRAFQDRIETRAAMLEKAALLAAHAAELA